MALDPVAHIALAWKVANSFRNVPDFESVACEALLALIHGAEAFDPSRGYRPSTFLVTVIRHACLSEVRRQRKRAREIPLYFVDETGEERERPDLPVVDPVAEQRVLAREVREAVERLPDRERLIVERRYGLHDGEPATAREVGQVVGLCQQRVAQIGARAEERLRQGMTRRPRGVRRSSR